MPHDAEKPRLSRRSALLRLSALGSGLTAAPSSAAPSRPNGPEVSITAPRRGPGRSEAPVLDLRTPRPRLFVVIRNPSARPLTLWAEQNSWGFNTLSLEVLALDGRPLPKPIRVERSRSLGWGGNILSTETLAPGESVVREVVLRLAGDPNQPAAPSAADPAEYLDLPGRWSPGDLRTIRMRAVLTIEPTHDARGVRPAVWTGRAASAARDYEVMLRTG